MTTLQGLRFQLQHDGQLANLLPIVAELEIEWGKRAVWENEEMRELSADAAYEIERRYRPEGWEPK